MTMDNIGPTTRMDARLAALDAAARVRAGDAVQSRTWMEAEDVTALAEKFEAWLLKAWSDL